MIIALAQTIPIKGDITKNLEHHHYCTSLAAQHKAVIILFPELSLTGFEPELAGELALTIDDERLQALSKVAREKNIIIAAGAPLKSQEIPETLPQIGQIFFFPNGSKKSYAKIYIHTDEVPYFSPGSEHLQLSVGNEKIHSAICADITNPKHPERASQLDSTIYLASVCVSKKGFAKDSAFLQSHATTYRMAVLMANYGGITGGYDCAGRSSVWSEDGTLVKEIPHDADGILLARKVDHVWSGEIIL